MVLRLLGKQKGSLSQRHPRQSAGVGKKRSAVGATASPGAWQLDDLKRINETSNARRAEGLLTRVKRLANEFVSGKPQSSNSESSISFETDAEIRRSLFVLNPATKIIRIERSMICCKAPRLDGMPRLFAPYGLKGGAARLGLQALLGEDVRHLRPRDIDVVRFGLKGDADQVALDNHMAEEHMPKDAAHGHGVEVCESIDSYLTNRDFTINEAVLMGGQIVVSAQALRDMYFGIVRPTQHLLKGGELLEGKMFMKALRFCSEMKARGRAAEFVDDNIHCVASPFDVALHLARALETSNGVAEDYLARAFAYGVLDAAEFGAGTLEEVKEGLSQILGPGVALFDKEPEPEVVRSVGIGFSVQRS
jgi:hypothetical protein